MMIGLMRGIRNNGFSFELFGRRRLITDWTDLHTVWHVSVTARGFIQPLHATLQCDGKCLKKTCLSLPSLQLWCSGTHTHACTASCHPQRSLWVCQSVCVQDATPLVELCAWIAFHACWGHAPQLDRWVTVCVCVHLCLGEGERLNGQFCSKSCWGFPSFLCVWAVKQ